MPSSSENPTEYDDYAFVRGGYDDGVQNDGGLALKESDLLAIQNPTNMPTRAFGLHRGFGHNARTTQDGSGNWIDDNPGVTGGIAKLYEDGKLSFLSNIGSLVEPTTRTDYNNNVNRPLGLFSHADLQRHWMTAAPHTRSQITGLGRKVGRPVCFEQPEPSGFDEYLHQWSEHLPNWRFGHPLHHR